MEGQLNAGRTKQSSFDFRSVAPTPTQHAENAAGDAIDDKCRDGAVNYLSWLSSKLPVSFKFPAINMANVEKHTVDSHGHDHRPDLERTRTDVDVIHVTTENPYKELNFIGTYAAIAFATCAAFAGFIMPVTALPLITLDIGTIEGIS